MYIQVSWQVGLQQMLLKHEGIQKQQQQQQQKQQQTDTGLLCNILLQVSTSFGL